MSLTLATIALDIGASILGGLLRKKGGETGGVVADVVDIGLKKIGEKLGVEPTEEAIVESYKQDPEKTKDALIEADTELSEVWINGVDGQFALLQAETSEGGLKSFWRYGWMYLLAIFWTWQIIIAPIVNISMQVDLAVVETGTLLQLTGWFMALYMGGHTLKELGKNVASAIGGR